MSLFLFDLDNTLITGYMDNPDKDYHRWDVLPGRVEKLADLIDRGDTIAVVTNQGGVAFGHISPDEVSARLMLVMRALHLPQPFVQDRGESQIPPTFKRLTYVYTCYSHPRGKRPWNTAVDSARRKPSGTMIREAIRDHANAAADGVLYVGDSERDDRPAAKDAGVPFQLASAFFGA